MSDSWFNEGPQGLSTQLWADLSTGSQVRAEGLKAGSVCVRSRTRPSGLSL